MLIKWCLCVREKEKEQEDLSRKMDDVMEDWRWEMDGYECMIGVFLVSDFGMIYRDFDA